MPSDPPDTDRNASRKSVTVEVRIHVVTAMNTGRSRTTPTPATTPAAPATTTPTSVAGSAGQPAFAVSNATENAPIAMNAPWLSDGIPASATVIHKPVAASARYKPFASESTWTHEGATAGTSAASATRATAPKY